MSGTVTGEVKGKR